MSDPSTTVRPSRRLPRQGSRGLGLLLGAALLLPAACSRVAPAPPVATVAPGTDTAEYVIGSGDVLSIFVYRAPELSVESLPVRPDGRIALPLVADIDAAGRTPSQLGEDIAKRLKEYVREPNVTVIVRSFVGPFDRQIRVIGEAAEPLALSYRDHMTVLDVMIAAHGLTRFAAGNSATIVRRVGAAQTIVRLRLSDLLKDGDISQNVEMQPGDTLIIPQSWF